MKAAQAAEVGRLSEAMSAAVATAAEKERASEKALSALSKAKAALEEERVSGWRGTAA